VKTHLAVELQQPVAAGATSCGNGCM